MNEEILSGLKNAKERGFSIESAAASFINAGYNKNEVQEATSFLLKGFSPLPTSTKEISVSEAKKTTSKETPFASISQNNPVAAKKEISSKTVWIILTIIGIIFLGAVISLIWFPTQFASLIDKIFP